MKHSNWFAALALLSLGCVRGAQSAPPSATPAPAAAVTQAPEARVPAVDQVASAPPAPASNTSATPAPPMKAVEASPEKPQPVRVRLIVPAGTMLPIEIQTPVSTETSHEGDPVLAVLTEDVALEGFKLDRGAEVRGRVLTAVAAKRTQGRAHLVVSFDAVMEKGEKLSIATEPIDSMAKSTRSKDTKIIAGSAAGGLIIGAIKDGGKGAAIGTLIGAAAGTGAVLIMKGDEVELARGARLTLTVTR